MEFSIPILYAQKPAGTLTAEPDGLYTVFTAVCRVPELRRLRLSVYDEDREGYLGLLLPDADGTLTLRKRLTRLECERLPRAPLFAAEEHAAFPTPAPAPDEPAPPPVDDAPPDDADVLWHAGPDGTLYATEGARAYIAIPESHAEVPPEARRLLREIDGSRYLVFPQ